MTPQSYAKQATCRLISVHYECRNLTDSNLYDVLGWLDMEYSEGLYRKGYVLFQKAGLEVRFNPEIYRNRDRIHGTKILCYGKHRQLIVKLEYIAIHVGTYFMSIPCKNKSKILVPTNIFDIFFILVTLRTFQMNYKAFLCDRCVLC